MAKLRVYELARDLNMTNKVLIEKMEAMNIVVKSHMSSLDDDIIDKIKENIREGKKEPAKVEEKRLKPTIIRRRKAAPEPEKAPEIRIEIDDEPEPVPEEEPDDELAEDSPLKPEVEPEEEEALSEAEPRENEEQTAPLPEDEESVQREESPKAETIQAAHKRRLPEMPEEMEPAAGMQQAAKGQATAPATPLAETVIPLRETKKTEVLKKDKLKKSKKHTAAKIIKLPERASEIAVEEALKSDAGETFRSSDVIPLPVAALPEGLPVEEDLKKDVKKLKKKKKRAEDEPAEKEDLDEDKKFFKKKISFRKKSVVEGTALYEGDKGRTRKTRKGAKVKAPIGEKTQITIPKAIKRRLKIDQTIALSELAKRMGVKANEMIQKLMTLGVMTTVNQIIDFETAVLVASEFGYELEKASFEEDLVIGMKPSDDPDKLVEKPPVVTIMGHVDHGKTSLLDVIRKTNVTDFEAGGMTQHIGAYNVSTDKGLITFLDTPGHEAFTSMRARGAIVTDIVVLVVAADDGVMPQTIEAINHAKAADVPLIVAINKMDKPDANPDRVKRELAEQGILSEDWGGEAIFVEVSAKQKLGIENLLDMILLQAEMLELKANPDKLATGYVIEAKLDSGRGPVATVLVQEGTLHAGDSVVCGIYYGKVRAMLNDKGVIVESAGPAIPVEVLGLGGVPDAGDELITLGDEKNAKQVSAHRIQKQREKELAKSSRLSLEGLFEKLAEGKVKELNLIIKADVHGSIEALKDSLIKLSGPEVKINVIHAATGTVSESDVSLAAVSNAIIIGFNVRPSSKVLDIAKDEHVDMRFYDIIYNVIKDIKNAMVGLMDSTFEEQILGRADVREVFVIPKKGSIAGSYVTDGKIDRGEHVRIVRDGIVIYDGIISSLRRFKDDAKEVTSGFECGIGIENFNDIKTGDILECYRLAEIKPKFD